MASPLRVYRSNHDRLMRVLTASDTTRTFFCSRLYSEQLISEHVMDKVHKDKETDYLLRELRPLFEKHFELILAIMESDEGLRDIAIDMRKQLQTVVDAPAHDQQLVDMETDSKQTDQGNCNLLQCVLSLIVQ